MLVWSKLLIEASLTTAADSATPVPGKTNELYVIDDRQIFAKKMCLPYPRDAAEDLDGDICVSWGVNEYCV